MSPHVYDDAELTALAMAARDGDQRSAAAFIGATQRDVVRFVAHLAGAEHADDLAQDTFIRFMKALPGFEGRSSARTWLLAIARHTVLDHLRAISRRPRVADLADWTATADRVTGGRRFDDKVLLEQLIGALDPDRREAFVATQLVGLSYQEAAEVIGCPVGTIRSRVARARDDLTAALGHETSAKRHLRAV